MIRVYGSILYATKKWGAAGERPVPLEPAHIDAWMQSCAAHGITSVLWRANCSGTLTYPNRFTALAGEPPLPMAEDRVVAGVTRARQSWNPEDWRWLGEQCRRFNTLDAAVRAAHRHGLKLLLDFNTFDMVGCLCTPDLWPGAGERAWNPDDWLWSRDRKTRLVGVPCYADPIVRRRRIGEIVEAMEIGVDGIALGFFSHCDSLSGDRACEFGFNPKVAAEYRRQHRAGPTTEQVDPHLLYAIQGEFFTQFVRDASDVVRREFGKQLIATTRVDGVHGWGGKTVASLINGDMQDVDLRARRAELPAYAAAFCLEWEKWLDEDLVDALLVAAPAQGGVAAIERMKRGRSAPMHLWRKFTATNGELAGPLTWSNYQAEFQAARDGRLDGCCLLPMQINSHPLFAPDWRKLLRPPQITA